MTIGEVKQVVVVAGIGTASGTNVYSVLIPEVKAYAQPFMIMVLFTNTNSGVPTLNINSLGALNLFKGATTAVAIGDIPAGQALIIYFNGTSLQIIGTADPVMQAKIIAETSARTAADTALQNQITQLQSDGITLSIFKVSNYATL